MSQSSQGVDPGELAEDATGPLDEVDSPVQEATGRDRFSTQVSRTVQNRARATVRGVRQATGRTYSLAQLTEDALRRHCMDLEASYHDGEPWPPDAARPLPPGRQ